MANTLATETTARIPPLSCIQTYKRICAGRHRTDTSSVDNPGCEGISDPLLGDYECVRTVPFYPSPPSRSNIVTSSCFQKGSFEVRCGDFFDLLPKACQEHGGVSEILGEHQRADGGAHAEDKSHVGEKQEILEDGWYWLLRGIGGRFEEDKKLGLYSR